jgi:hypothetical protein
MRITILLLVLMMSLSGCLTVKPGSTKSGMKFFETFFVGEEGTQYFIKPLDMVSVNSPEEFSVDFTFRYNSHLAQGSQVKMNFTLSSNDIVRKIDSLKIYSGNGSTTISQNQLLFNGKHKKLFTSRFTSEINLADLTDLMSDIWYVEVFHNNQKLRFSHSRKSRKAIAKLNEKVFVLIDLE